MCVLQIFFFDNNGEFKYFWLLDLYQVEYIKNVVIFGFLYGISNRYSNIYLDLQLFKFRKKAM